MALFHILRYPGPEAAAAAAKEEEAGAGERARVLLERLQSRARERQQRQPAPPEAAPHSEASGRRRRRPRRRRRGSPEAPGSSEAPQEKRPRADDQHESAEAGVPGRRAGLPSRAPAGADAPLGPGVRAESSEEALGEQGARAEAAPDVPPAEEAAEPTASALMLGGFGRRKAPKVQPFLPVWLAEPSCIRKNIAEGLVPVEDIPEVHPDLQKQLRAQGISFYFPVQAAVIPTLLESAANGFLVGRGGYQPSDLCVSAPTGSGKTLAFVIPVVQALLRRVVCHVRALVVLPTKELAQQVIDEADRMIDSMHQSWLPRVVAAAFQREGPTDPCAVLQRRQLQAVTAASTYCPQMPLQKLLFSATLTQNPEKLQQLGLHQPRLFSTSLACKGPQDGDGDVGGKYAFPVGLTHHYVPCSLSTKPLLVLHLILEKSFSRVLCFTNSRENSHRLSLLVQAFGGVSVAEFSSRYGPGQRRMILKQFEQGKIQLLISTDATARGIDVQGVELVINYDAPQYLRTYVHRVGRTARAGNAGQAFTLLLKVQERRFLRMLTEGGVPALQRHELHSELLQPLVPRYEEALSQLERTVKEEQKQKVA
ncbi:ATP-dependent RNA helicase DDX51 isoform X3 [Nycticebus coucang]|uniref:ATP-dependent RNA helicase DDX51 isoform X3 n=1 Tax=Nycticebus coucang TaxID=9470 RepID=UPI00234E006B|nr:ATP-dependent RNA helicase DDX51 isoform X3 [Nycticebus coucang]